YNTITNREAQPGAAAHIFGGEERIENLGEVFRRDADAGVFDFDGRLSGGAGCAQGQYSAIGHRVDGICGQRHHRLLQLPFVSKHKRERSGGFDFDLNIVATVLVSNQPGSGLNQFSQVYRYTIAGPQAAEIEESIGDVLAAESFVANQAE